MAESELRERTEKRLLKETEDAGRAAFLAGQLIDAATDRLVLLVAPDAGYVGFEIRSLQEYMAARALISGPEADIIPRLEALAPSSSWRNTWLLAAAGIFPTKPHLRGDLLNALRALDSRDEVTMTLAPGARLAMELLDEGITRQHPRFHSLLVDHATTLIGQVPRLDHHRHYAHTLLEAATAHTQARARVEHALKDALNARDGRLVTALIVLQVWKQSRQEARILAQRLWTATSARPSSEERAAFNTLALIEHPNAQRLQEKFTVVGEANLADFAQPHLPPHGEEQRSGTLADFVADLAHHPVHQARPKNARLNHIDVAIVETSAPLDTRGALQAMGDPQALQLCLDVIDAQPMTAWPVAMAFMQLLDFLAYPTLTASTSPHVEGNS